MFLWRVNIFRKRSFTSITTISSLCVKKKIISKIKQGEQKGPQTTNQQSHSQSIGDKQLNELLANNKSKNLKMYS